MQPGADLLRDYETRCAALEDLGPVAERLIQELLTAAGIRVHSVRYRIKTKESLQRKVGRKDVSYDSLGDVHDLLGLRVITLFSDEVDRVADVIESEFSVDFDNSVDKRALLDPDRFGYLSLHYVARLNEDRASLAEHKRFDGVLFEIQIRSILQHVWAEIEHDLGYHVADAIPDPFRRRFSRLAGLLEIADDEFETLRKEITNHQLNVGEGIVKDPESVRIDQDSVTALIRENSRLRELDQYIADALETRICKEDEFLDAGFLTKGLQWVGMETVADVSRLLDEKYAHICAFADALAENAKDEADGAGYGISLLYLNYVLVTESESRERVGEFLKASQIGRLDPPDGAYLSVADELLEAHAAARRVLEDG